MSAPAFRLEGVLVRHGSHVVLDVPRLEIPRGQSIALVGPNGAGKTTLLRVLALLDAPSSGRVEILGRVVPAGERGRAALRRDVTLVAQTPFLFRRSVAANVAYGLRVRGEPARERVEAALASVGLEGFGQRPARKLSAGESQRVALARALALDPPVVLFDEPAASVDRERAPDVERAIARLRGTGKTVVLATHDFGQAARLADAVLSLVDGRIAPPVPAA